MKFLVDAQLPRRMVEWLKSAALDAIHTLDLPDGNRTTDAKISEFADSHDRVVVTKDADFVNSHLLQGKPAKLLLVSSGNISNNELHSLFAPLIPQLTTELSTSDFVELSRDGITIR